MTPLEARLVAFLESAMFHSAGEWRMPGAEQDAARALIRDLKSPRDVAGPGDIVFRIDVKPSEFAQWRRTEATLSRMALEDVRERVKGIPELARVFGGVRAQEEHVRMHREAVARLLRAALEAAVHKMVWSLAKEMVPDDLR